MSEVLDCLNELINDVMLHAQSFGTSYGEAYFEKINTILTENGDVKDDTEDLIDVLNDMTFLDEDAAKEVARRFDLEI